MVRDHVAVRRVCSLAPAALACDAASRPRRGSIPVRAHARPRAAAQAWLAVGCLAALAPVTGCEPEPAETTAEAEAAAFVESLELLAPEAQLVRISLALRGLRPTAAEFERVAADPDALAAIVDTYLQGPEFGAVIRDLHNDGLLARVDARVPPAGFEATGPLAGRDAYQINRSIMDAPLRLAQHIVLEDRPYTELVTADYTVADATVAAVWGLPFDPSAADGEGWAVTTQADARGNAGWLTDSWVFVRHDSTAANQNRGRANALTRALLCEDFLARPADIETVVDLADPNAVNEAVRSEPSCVGCHQSLDPLASFFAGYIPQIASIGASYPISLYSPGFFPLIYGVDLRDPNYFGRAGTTLQDLGQMIASDPRFSRCAARRFYSYFHHVPLEEVPEDRVQHLQAVLVDSDHSAKALIRAIVLSDDFRAARVRDDAELSEAGLARARGVGLFKTRPTQLGIFFQATTGLRWTANLRQYDVALGTPDAMDDTFVGFHMLGGGIDGIYVTRPTLTYNATSSLLLQALARDGAGLVVTSDFANPDRASRRLLREVDTLTTDVAAIRAQLAALHLDLYGERVAADDPALDPLVELLQAGASAAQPGFGQPPAAAQGWMVVLDAMLQDPRIAFH
jgi:hypothetical protein